MNVNQNRRVWASFVFPGIGFVMLALTLSTTPAIARDHHGKIPAIKRGSASGHIHISKHGIRAVPKGGHHDSGHNHSRGIRSTGHFSRFGRHVIRPGRGFSCFYSYHPDCFRSFRIFSFAYYPVFVPGFFDYAFGFAFGYPYYYPYGYGYGYGYPYGRYPYRRPYGWWRDNGEYGGEYAAIGEIWFDVKPSDALIYVDGKLWGTAGDLNGWWKSKDLPAGKHTIRIEAPGYDTYETQITIRPDKKVKIKVKLQRAETARLQNDPENDHLSALLIHSDEPLEAVQVNGQAVPVQYDTTAKAWVIWIQPGQYRIDLFARNRSTISQPVNIHGKYTHLVVAF